MEELSFIEESPYLVISDDDGKNELMYFVWKYKFEDENHDRGFKLVFQFDKSFTFSFYEDDDKNEINEIDTPPLLERQYTYHKYVNAYKFLEDSSNCTAVVGGWTDLSTMERYPNNENVSILKMNDEFYEICRKRRDRDIHYLIYKDNKLIKKHIYKRC